MRTRTFGEVLDIVGCYVLLLLFGYWIVWHESWKFIKKLIGKYDEGAENPLQ